MKNQVLQSRRKHKRIDDPQGVWVYWRCGHSEDTSRVRDISVGGIFIETQKTLSIDATVELNFLVEDGGIVAEKYPHRRSATFCSHDEADHPLWMTTARTFMFAGAKRISPTPE